MKQLSKTKKILIVCIILNLIVWTGYGFTFWKIRAQNIHISTLSNEVEIDMKKDESLRAIKSSLDENKDFLSKADAYFVPNEGVVGFIDTLESYGKQRNVDVTIGSVSVEPDSQNKGDFKEALRLKIEAIGTWNNLESYLLTLENLPYATRLDQVSYISNGNSIQATGVSQKSAPSVSRQWKGYFEFVVLKLR